MNGRASPRHRRDRTARIAGIASALCFGLSAVISLLAPEGIDLGQWLLMLDPSLHAWLQRHAGGALWTGLIGPILVRPAWLLPAMAGALAATLAWTVSSGRRARR
ncbi:hypothetical protein FHR90_001244 [Endobacter medicaginis]|uniref:Uncharacterized protein n=1 Tax=Endobacter medicaginis TaxID=1181271 RepID=A0A850NP15_9PROT|nr:hypothetical protein [Endobacter medicaginis]MBB3173421.1 hypothetical protein [Endobacter medicaginis]MCX5475467.1 hypothetical protein [Endobacter medicaginis]NVN28875.1 hypothetical protein [Endobacter medicaginis]